jgi:hypothetical protein
MKIKETFILWLFASVLAFSCKKDNEPELNENILSEYLELNCELSRGDIVACAGGKEGGLIGSASEPTDVFFYPVEGATDFRYFEAENIADSLDFSKYIAKSLDDEPMFNGYLWKFNNTTFSGERMGAVTYKTPGTIHVCTPIRLKTNVKPTEVNPNLGQVTENGVTPSFTWMDGEIEENVIYFQVISDMDNNFISGTYTVETNWTFYDLSNVVFNVTDPDSNPTLEPNQTYKFTMMGVSEDNWVNLIIEKEFSTE